MQGGIQNDVIKAEVVFKVYSGYSIKGIFLLVESFAVKAQYHGGSVLRSLFGKWTSIKMPTNMVPGMYHLNNQHIKVCYTDVLVLG